MLPPSGLILLLTWFSSLAMAGVPSEGEDLWKKYLQIPRGGSVSEFRPSPFFLSVDGPRNPSAEYEASIAAFMQGRRLVVETEEMPIACALPFRRRLLEKWLGRSFTPAESCPALERWKKAFSASRLSMVFAGAFVNNPASLFGHTFLRFGRAGEDRAISLRTYSAAFMAGVHPEDGQTTTIVKGLLGLYDGAFLVKPHYMNAALYNNSESRDLWDYPLRLSEAEVDEAVLLLWEYANLAIGGYRFQDENCSYRLLAFLDVIKPSANLADGAGLFVLPGETLRLLDQKGLIASAPAFEPSIRRRIDAGLENFGADERRLFRQARTDIAAVREIRDPALLDVLIEDGTRRVYGGLGKLPPQESSAREEALLRRSGMGTSASVPIPVAAGPIEGHRPSWVRSGVIEGGASTLSVFSGAHDLAAPSRGYDGFAAIRYLGFESTFAQGEIADAAFRMADVAALNPFSREFPTPSWAFDVAFKGGRDRRGGWRNGFDVGAGLGLTRAVGPGNFASVLSEIRGWGDERALQGGQAAPGLRGIVRLERDRWVFLVEGRVVTGSFGTREEGHLYIGREIHSALWDVSVRTGRIDGGAGDPRLESGLRFFW